MYIVHAPEVIVFAYPYLMSIIERVEHLFPVLYAQGAYYQVFINAKHVANFKSRSKNPAAELAQIKHFVIRTGFEIVGFNIPRSFVPGTFMRLSYRVGLACLVAHFGFF